MVTELSEDQISSYRDNGFLILDEFLNPEELQAWRERGDEAVARRRGARQPGDDPDAKTGNNRALLITANLRMDFPEMRKLLLDPRIGKLVADLEGVDNVRVYQDVAFYKPPWANPTGWHQDDRKWAFTSEHAITIWIALEDVTLQSGCLFFLPGTHHKRLDKDFGSGGKVSALFEAYPEFSTLEPAPAVLKAGGCSFHNGWMLHAAAANMTPKSRKAVTCAYMPDGSTFNGVSNALPESFTAGLKAGDFLDNEEFYPVVYQN